MTASGKYFGKRMKKMRNIERRENLKCTPGENWRVVIFIQNAQGQESLSSVDSVIGQNRHVVGSRHFPVKRDETGDLSRDVVDAEVRVTVAQTVHDLTNRVFVCCRHLEWDQVTAWEEKDIFTALDEKKDPDPEKQWRG